MVRRAQVKQVEQELSRSRRELQRQRQQVEGSARPVAAAAEAAAATEAAAAAAAAADHRIAEDNSQVAQLRSEVANLRRDIQETRRERDHYEEMVAVLEMQRTALVTERAKVKDMHAAHKAAAGATATTFDANEQELQQLRHELDAQRVEGSRLQKALAETRRMVTRMQRERDLQDAAAVESRAAWAASRVRSEMEVSDIKRSFQRCVCAYMWRRDCWTERHCVFVVDPCQQLESARREAAAEKSRAHKVAIF